MGHNQEKDKGGRGMVHGACVDMMPVSELLETRSLAKKVVRNFLVSGDTRLGCYLETSISFVISIP